MTPDTDPLPIEEAEWIRAAQAGDKSAFARLIERYWERLYRWLYRMTRDRHAAEDLTQETFLKALLFLRLKFPRAELTVTTRERADLRDRTLAFGVTKLSAGVSTAPGGYGHSDEATPQFSIHDERSLAD